MVRDPKQERKMIISEVSRQAFFLWILYHTTWGFTAQHLKTAQPRTSPDISDETIQCLQYLRLPSLQQPLQRQPLKTKTTTKTKTNQNKSIRWWWWWETWGAARTVHSLSTKWLVVHTNSSLHIISDKFLREVSDKFPRQSGLGIEVKHISIMSPLGQIIYSQVMI